MREIPDDIMAGISALEASADHQAKIRAIQDWQGLSPGQRVVALVIASLEFVSSTPPGSLAVSRFTGMPQERIEKIFDGVDHPPYYWSEVPNTRHWAFLPGQALEYGEA